MSTSTSRTQPPIGNIPRCKPPSLRALALGAVWAAACVGLPAQAQVAITTVNANDSARNHDTIQGVTTQSYNGPIASGGGSLSAGDCTFGSGSLAGNTANGSGGAIDNLSDGNLTVANSTISSNQANGSGPDGGSGAGIANDGVLVVRGSTFSGNTALGDHGGGGVVNPKPGQALAAWASSA